jgi:hypothetical protein
VTHPLFILALVTHFQGDDHIILFYFDAMADVEIGIISFHMLSRDAQALLPQVVHSQVLFENFKFPLKILQYNHIFTYRLL